MNRNIKSFNIGKILFFMILAGMFSIFCGLGFEKVINAANVGDGAVVYYEDDNQTEWSKSKVVGVLVPDSISANYGVFIEGVEDAYSYSEVDGQGRQRSTGAPISLRRGYKRGLCGYIF